MKEKTIKEMLIIAILLISLATFSCNFTSEKNNNVEADTREVVTIYDYQVWLSNLDKKELRDSSVYYIDTFSMNNRLNWAYNSKNDSIFYEGSYVYLSFGYYYAIENDSLFIRDLYCPNLDTIYLQYENEKIELIRSYYNEENSCDEECFVYWNHDYGLVALYNFPWGALLLIDKETKKGFAKEIFMMTL
jgi:hypothetical protein